MYWIVKLVQSLVKALNSEGTPGQVAAGIALGSCLGLTPLLNLHNLLIAGVILFFRVSVPGATLGWFVFTPVGFLLDPLFHRLGSALLLELGALRGVWASAYNTPGVALANPTNTIVLGSFVAWAVLAVPIYHLARVGVGWYRRTIYERYKDAKFFRWLKASKAYDVYRLFRPSV
ncbi:MAG TPA: TIGR03546 family protein [Longimicrobiales bacterium]|nr:TIGR03546 family protein [Longimicrobiales bacterium]